MSAPSATQAISDKAGAAISYAQRSFDRVVPPPSRERAYSTASTYASERPIAFSLAATLLAVSSFFVITFSIFTLSTLSLALGAALLFTLFWAGVALAFLVPALLGSLIAAGVVWAWLVGSFLVARWLYVRVPLVAGAVTGSVGGSSGADTRYSSSSTYTSDGKNGTAGGAAPVYDAVNVKTSKLDPGRANVYTAN